MAAKIVGIPSVLNIVNIVTEVDIMVCNSLDWTILTVGLGEREFSSCEGCFVPLYDCLFTILGICLLLSDFAMVVIDHLKVPHRNFILELGIL